MQGVTLTYEAAVTGVGNYLCAQVEGGINHYQMKMLENNQIPGLLAARGSMFNGVYRINYEIDGTHRLGAVLQGGSLRGEAAKRFMGGLLRSLSGLGEYFLSYMQCLLDVDYIYVDQRGRAKIVYLPLQRQVLSDEEGVRQFCQKLFAEYFTADGDPFFLRLLRYVSMQDFSFSGLLGYFEEGDGENDRDPGMQAAGQRPEDTGPLVQAASAAPEKKFGFLGKVVSAGTASGGQGGQNSGDGKDGVCSLDHGKEGGGMESMAAGAGFAIPGGGFAVPQADTDGKKKDGKKKDDKKGEKEKKQKEKGASLFKSLLGGKKEKEGGKVQPQIPDPGAGKGFSGHADGTPSGGAYPDSGRMAGGWQGTVMLGGNETGGSTMMLGVGTAPYLLYEGQKISLEHFPFTLGKENTDYVFSKNVVSRMHANISSRNGVYYVMDENSKNHTYLNGKMLSPYTETLLQDGDTLKLASEVMTFHIG